MGRDPAIQLVHRDVVLANVLLAFERAVVPARLVVSRYARDDRAANLLLLVPRNVGALAHSSDNLIFHENNIRTALLRQGNDWRSFTSSRRYEFHRDIHGVEYTTVKFGFI